VFTTAIQLNISTRFYVSCKLIASMFQTWSTLCITCLLLSFTTVTHLFLSLVECHGTRDVEVTQESRVSISYLDGGNKFFDFGESRLATALSIVSGTILLLLCTCYQSIACLLHHGCGPHMLLVTV